MIGESILDIHAGNSSDENIKSYEYNDYQPITGSQLNTAGQITITIENQDQFVHLHNSYLIIEGDVLKADNSRYADADMVSLTNNGLYLFSSIKLTLAGQEVEHVDSPGFASTLMGLASYSGDFNKGCGLSQCWYPGNVLTAAAENTGFAIRQQFLVQKPNPKGSFQFAILLRHISGFMDDYSKVTYGMRDTLQLIRTDDNDALFGTNAAGAGKVVLSKIAWSVPIVEPNDVKRVKMYKSIASNAVIPVSFRLRQCETFSVPQTTSTVWRLGVKAAPEKPRWVLIGLQTGKSGDQQQNPALFDHCNVTNMQVLLNHTRYPSVDMLTDFAKEQFAGVYKSFFDFDSRYYGIDSLLAGSDVNPSSFNDLYPVHVFDVSKQSERLTEGIVDITVLFIRKYSKRQQFVQLEY